MRARLLISPFNSADQDAVRALVLSGLADHFDDFDPALNPDLDDIAAHYAGADFLVARRATVARRAAVARLDGEIVGCGALVPRAAETGEIVRMSVAQDRRRQGIGRGLLDALCTAARARGMTRVVLETTSSWTGVRRFYEDYGFKLSHYEQHTHEHQAHYVLEV